MKLSVNWLKDFLPSFSPDISRFVEQLTYLGFEVEEVHARPLPDKLVVTGRIEEIERHPDAERLSVCKVDTGCGEFLQIVCGAPNLRCGMVVPVATIGAKLRLPDGTEPVIKRSRIRGVLSFGMICAADELGLSGDHSGVMELGASLALGRPLSELFDEDVIFEIAVTPNRPDVLSHLGMARELASPEEIVLPVRHEVDFSGSGSLVDILDTGCCPYYTAVVVRGVRVTESPEWLKTRLESIGLKPKNNIVDITNYLLHALGQPLHVFDLNRLSGHRVVVRSDMTADFVTLDHTTCNVQPGMPVICDADKPAALAGVMGGLDSAVTVETTDILLESAYFTPSCVRKSARKTGLSSDSSYRFERGVDPLNVKRAAECALALILELAGGQVVAAEERGSLPPVNSDVPLRPERVNAILGSSLSPETMRDILGRLGFKSVAGEDPESMRFQVPSWRVDVSQEIDLIEEVARVYGYDRIDASDRMTTIYPQFRKVPEYFPDYLRGILVGLDFREILTNPLIRRSEAELFDRRVVAALNPISEGLEVLRPSLYPSFFKVIAHNIRHGNRDLRFFEIARSFLCKDSPDGNGSLDAFSERESLVMAITGSRYPRLWNQPSGKSDVYDMTGAVEMLLEKLNLLEKSSLITYNNTVCIDIEPAGQEREPACRAGTVQMVDSALLREFGVGQDVFLAEFDMAVLENAFSPRVVYESPSKFPAVQKDLSFMLPREVAVGELVDVVRSSDPLIRSVSVFDHFERVAESGGERSVALSLVIADHTGTLQDGRINGILERAGRNAGKKLGAVIRQA